MLRLQVEKAVIFQSAGEGFMEPLFSPPSDRSRIELMDAEAL
ncbi:hypothetical protein [Streptomyces sp. NPDC055134]